VVLASPTVIVGDVNGNSGFNYDDEFFEVDLPFPLTIYGISNSTVYVGINGVCKTKA
jgi:hypothetical protein